MIDAVPDPAAGRHPLGLTASEVRERLAKFGSNVTPDASIHPLQMVLEKFWSPIPWMLEAAIVLELARGKWLEGAIIGALLILNAVLGLFQESRAQATLAVLKSQLALNAAVCRDGIWTIVPASQLVPGDVVKLSLGAVVPADVRLLDGSVLLDQSMLTGESLPIDAGTGIETYAGALVRRGEATAEVIATGGRTRFGRAAELVRTAHVVSTQQKAVVHVARNLVIVNAFVIVLLISYSWMQGLRLSEIIALGLTAVLAAIPVGLPATFTLASALGARVLTRQGVLPTRLSAVDEAASMDVLCSDKTGTLTRNELSVTAVRPMQGFDEGKVLMLAALASSEGGADPVDRAVRAAAGGVTRSAISLVRFTPFDPADKRSEALVEIPALGERRIIKGAFAVVSQLAEARPEAAAAAEALGSSGYRVLAVAFGPPDSLELAGLLALSDPPRPDAASLISRLRDLGVKTIMATGDAPVTARFVAREVGLEGPAFPGSSVPEKIHAEQFAVYAGVLPEDKFRLVKALQANGHVVGMCGDGANDAPALRQAQMGIAVSTATDVARSAAGIVLTEPGLAGVVAAVEVGRMAFRRVLTYTLNSVTKKTVQALFLFVGLIMSGHAILTPHLMVLVMITGDFLGLALTTDNVRASLTPNSWRIGEITAHGVLVGLGELAFCTAMLAFGIHHLGLGVQTQQTLAFVLIVFGNQAICYINRDSRHWWSSRPSTWVIVSSLVDVLIASSLAISGLGMARLPAWLVAIALGAAIVFLVAFDFLKRPVLVAGRRIMHPAQRT